MALQTPAEQATHDIYAYHMVQHAREQIAKEIEEFGWEILKRNYASTENKYYANEALVRAIYIAKGLK